MFRNCSTAADTRSLSVNLLSGKDESSSTNSTLNLALIYYETPTGKVSALLQRSTGWVNITSQTSHSLPDEIHNPTVFFGSRTLYNNESDPNSLFTPPFISVGNYSESTTGEIAGIGAFLYSPHYASIFSDGYQVGQSGYGNFSLGMRHRASSPEQLGAS